MSTSSNQSIVQGFRHRYSPSLATNVMNLAAAGVDISAVDTIVLDDTGGGATCVLTLPKMGSALFPIGQRLTIRKASTVAFTVTVTPTAPDVVSGAIGAYPSVAATTVLHLPASVPNSVTFEAMSLHVTTGVENPLTSPTVGGIWMCVASSVASV